MVATDNDTNRERKVGTSRRNFMKLSGAGTAVALSGCTGGNGNSSLGGSTIKLGAVFPQTGSYAALGEQFQKGFEFGIEEMNNKDKYEFELEPHIADSQSSPQTGTQVMQRLMQEEDIDTFLGGTSAVSLAMSELARQEELHYWSCGTAVSITAEECNPYTFRYESHVGMTSAPMAPYAVNNLGTNVWFHSADYAFGNSVYEWYSKRMSEANSEFNEVEFTKSQLGTSSYDSVITQIKNSDAEVVVSGMSGGDQINFIKQATNQGLKEEVDIVATTLPARIIRAGAGSAAIGAYGEAWYVASIETGDNPEFVEAWNNQFDSNPDVFSRMTRDITKIIAEGIQRSGSTDRDDVRSEIKGSTFKTTMGDNIQVRESDHQAVLPTWATKIVEPSGDTPVPEVKVLEKVEGEDSLPPASELGCSM